MAPTVSSHYLLSMWLHVFVHAGITVNRVSKKDLYGTVGSRYSAVGYGTILHAA